MNVRELIQALKALPEDLPVYLSDWSEGYAPDIPIDHVDIEENGPQMLPRVADAVVRPPRWDHPRRVVIG